MGISENHITLCLPIGHLLISKTELNVQRFDTKVDPECLKAYDSFLRTQVFNDVDSNLLKNLDSSKRAEIEKFKNYDRFNQLEKIRHQKYNAYEDALRQEQIMQVSLRI